MADVAVVSGTVGLACYSATVELIETAQATNDRLQALTLLAKTRPNTNFLRDVRAGLVAGGRLALLVAEIPLGEAIARAEGTTPLNSDAYEAVCAEIIQRTTHVGTRS